MKIIVLFNETTHRAYNTILSHLKVRTEFCIFTPHTLVDLENIIHKYTIDVLLLFSYREPSVQLVDMISKNKNNVQLRDTETLFVQQRASNSGTQKALMMGAKSVFLEPIHEKKVVRAVENAADHFPSELRILPGMIKIHLPAQLTAFGRIGKVFLDPAGDMQVETDLQLHSGQEVEMSLQIAQDLGLLKCFFRVKSRNTIDIYYKYENSYRFSWIRDPILDKKLEKWVLDKKPFFSIPKTKLLWVSESPIAKWEQIFDKSIFSVYTQIPGRLTRSYLDELNPKIVICDALPVVTKTCLVNWMSVQDGQKKLVISTVPEANEDWSFIGVKDCEGFRSQLIPLVKPYLLERVSSSLRHCRYISRKSPYSRVAILQEAKVVGVASAHLLIELNSSLALNTIVLLDSPAFEVQKERSLYLKVLQITPGHLSRFRLVCEVLPISDDIHPVIKSWMTKYSISPEFSVLPSTRASQRNSIYFIRKRSHLIQIGKILIVLTGFFLLGSITYFLLPKNKIKGRQPAQMKDVFRSIRNRFK